MIFEIKMKFGDETKAISLGFLISTPHPLEAKIQLKRKSKLKGEKSSVFLNFDEKILQGQGNLPLLVWIHQTVTSVCIYQTHLSASTPYT